jgi:hypothetical protein
MDKEELNFSKIKPELKEYILHEGDGKVIVENPENERQIVLPSEHIDIVDCLDGEHTVKDVVEHLYAVGGSVSFNSVIKTIRLLDTIDLLHENFNELFESFLVNLKSLRSPKREYFFLFSLD